MRHACFVLVGDVIHVLNFSTRHPVNVNLSSLAEEVENLSRLLGVCSLQAFPSPFSPALKYFVLVPNQGLRLSIADG